MQNKFAKFCSYQIVLCLFILAANAHALSPMPAQNVQSQACLYFDQNKTTLSAESEKALQNTLDLAESAANVSIEIQIPVNSIIQSPVQNAPTSNETTVDRLRLAIEQHHNLALRLEPFLIKKRAAWSTASSFFMPPREYGNCQAILIARFAAPSEVCKGYGPCRVTCSSTRCYENQ
ncbi:hypothetical protein [Uliginosibacterium sediminicola]|uniref:Secreted protein n=1 Tax=Uliginosibacterium sediminicola TaxID=2024550 RepID=A0ABU9Z1G3_9RHOO